LSDAKGECTHATAAAAAAAAAAKHTPTAKNDDLPR
jgi:hypothetical protein